MAQKVNKNVVLMLIGGTVCVVAAIAFMLMFVVKSGADLAAKGDRLMAEGDYEGAALSFSKAANKEQNNVEYVRKWASALSAQNPESLQAYSDRYRSWVETQVAIARVLRNDPEAHAAVLELTVRDARTSGRSGPTWQRLESAADDIINRMKGEPQEKLDRIRRYRGMATVGKISQSLDVSAEDRARAKEDLKAALVLRPDDAMVASNLADLLRLNAIKAIQSANPEQAELALAEGKAFIDDYVSKHPSLTLPRLAKLSMEMTELGYRAQSNPSLLQSMKDMIPRSTEELVRTLEAEDVKTIDVFVASQVLDLALQNRVDNGPARGVALLDRVVAARPDEPFARLMRARFRNSAGLYKEAAEDFKSIMALPNMKVSTEGITLFAVRDMASIQRVDALIAMVEMAKAPEDRTAALAAAKSARDEVKARSTVEDFNKLLLDAKIALLSGDGADARRLLGQYHQQTNYSDPVALMLSARVMVSQGMRGEAKSMIQRVIEMRRAGLDAYRMLSLLEFEMRNLTAALNAVEQGLAISPNDEQLLTLRKGITDAIDGVNSTDPVTRAAAEAEAALRTTPPDRDRLRAKANEIMTLAATPEQFVLGVRFMSALSRPDGAAAAARGLERFPGNEVLKRVQAALSVEDPVKAQLDAIEADADLSKSGKALRRYMTLMSAGQQQESMKALEELRSLEPEHAVVVTYDFEKLINEVLAAKPEDKPGLIQRAQQLAQKAADQNIDKVGGAIYKARLLESEGKHAEAVPLLERASEQDPLNPMTWLYLGNAYVITGDLSKGLKAMERCLQIKPDMMSAIVARIRILASLDRANDALAAAREASRMGVIEPQFVNLWLILEFRVGDKDLALERRAWIYKQDPANTVNAIEYARCLIQARRVDEAQTVLGPLANKEGFADEVAMLTASLRGAKGDTAGALADFEKLIDGIKSERPDAARVKEDAYLTFAGFASTLGNTELVVQTLEKARATQDPKLSRVDRTLGDTYFGITKWDEARAAYQRARDNSPDDDNKLLLKRIIECHLKARQFDQAEALLQKEGGDTTKDVQLLLLAAQLAEAKGDRPRAANMLDKAVEAAPTTALPYRQRAAFKLADIKTIDDAIVDLEQAAGIEPRNAEIRLLLSNAFRRKGEPARALEVLEQGLATQADNGQWRIEQINLLLNLGRTADAVASAQAAMKAEPSNVRWPLLWGVVLQRTNDPPGAVRAYEQAWSLLRSPETGKALADALMANYDQTKDKSLLSRAKEIVADEAFGVQTQGLSRLTRASLMLREGNRAEAIGDLREAIKLVADRISDQQMSLIIVDEMRRAANGDMSAASAMLDEVRPAQGWPDAFRVNLARAKLATPGLRSGALDELETLMTSSDKAAAIGAASSLGNQSYVDRNFDRAVKAYQQGLTLDPESVELNNNLAYVLSKGMGKHADALPRALKAAEKDPNNPNILDTVGVIYMQLNDLDKAETYLSRARASATDALSRVMPLLHTIEIKLKKGQTAEASALYQEVQSLVANDPRIKSNYGADVLEIEKKLQAQP